MIGATVFSFFFSMEIEIPSIPSEFKNVTVLLPDHLLCHSTTISSKIANATIVADSTFGSCCIDQTTISHTATDCIVKYGDSCLSKPNTTIPIYHVFDTFPVAIDLVIENLKQFEKVLVFTSTDCYHIMNKLSCNVIPTIIPTEYPIKPFAHTHSIRGRYFTLPDGITINDIPIVYVGQDTLELSSILMALPNAMIFDPVHNTLSADVKTSKAFGKRFFMVEKAKDADTIGIVVGTLSIGMSFYGE
jgi:diphthamide biosynthesis protein 2